MGKPLLALLVSEASPYSRVYSFARRAHPSPPAVSSNVEFKEVLVDFEKLHDGDAAEQAKLSAVSADAIFITMGTTRAAAGSMAAFERIDRGYVLSAAKALLSNPDNTKRTLLYCSSGSSSSSSLFPYLKSKGLTEEGLAKLCPHTIILRPGFLQHAQRQQTRLLERMFEPAMALAARSKAARWVSSAVTAVLPKRSFKVAQPSGMVASATRTPKPRICHLRGLARRAKLRTSKIPTPSAKYAIVPREPPPAMTISAPTMPL